MPVTGDKIGKSVQTFSVSGAANALVTEVNLKSATHPINIKHLSGKYPGCYVAVKLASGKITFAVAQGDAPTDAWSILSLVATDVVPV
ncbi:hypothetical protein ACTG2W_00705 [Aeromonas sp. 96A]|uniref:acetyl-CoA acetyltransferase n=1 Tax=Aeromonas TaxID=642 RepID=UPI0007B5AF46|nr:acetyl-CoA acetyltransferase [Aeromonas veronii]ANB69327.1 hypothetical protein A6033_12715 [Aeromonas veronii]MCJ8234746.1 hypothetical protein [Aeromonas veronii]PSJ87770.1 acetyl-CoA acetyltransferase [Aeromonas veronii]